MSALHREREQTAGPDNGPQAPFPLRLDGKVIKGFGRGSSEVSVCPSRAYTARNKQKDVLYQHMLLMRLPAVNPAHALHRMQQRVRHVHQPWS